jgi:hypothetical protein
MPAGVGSCAQEPKETPSYLTTGSGRRWLLLGLPLFAGLLGGAGKAHPPVLYRRDHVETDIVMLATSASIFTGQLDPLPLQVVNSADVLIVRADHVHVFLDLRGVHDCFLSCSLGLAGQRRARREQ